MQVIIIINEHFVLCYNVCFTREVTNESVRLKPKNVTLNLQITFIVPVH